MPQIEHVVIVMMENHSYDNYFGMLTDRGEHFPLDPSGQPTPTNSGEHGPVAVHHRPDTRQLPGVPTQSWSASHLQWNNGRLDGFVQTAEKRDPANGDIAMAYWTDNELPFYYDLARTFTLCDHWFCSCLGPTFPNRRFLIAGTANALIDDLPFGMLDYPASGTIFDLLTRHGVSWANYHSGPNSTPLIKRVFGKRGLMAIRAVARGLSHLLPPLKQSALGSLQFTADLYPLGLLGCLSHVRTIRQFLDDAAEGSLPSVSIVDPDFTHDSEENAQDIQLGEAFASTIVNAAMHGKAWDKTLLIWLYDEHGGYYDHVDPPDAIPPDNVPGHSLLNAPAPVRWLIQRLGRWQDLQDADQGPQTYDRLGFRVPAVIVSPYAKPGYVDSTIYDHTSVLKFIEWQWNLPPLTARDATANNILSALDLDGAPPFASPPQLAAPARPYMMR